MKIMVTLGYSHEHKLLGNKRLFGFEGRDTFSGKRKESYWQLREQLHSVQNGFRSSLSVYRPVPAAARSKACVCGLSLAGIVGSNPANGMDVCLL